MYSTENLVGVLKDATQGVNKVTKNLKAILAVEVDWHDAAKDSGPLSNSW